MARGLKFGLRARHEHHQSATRPDPYTAFSRGDIETVLNAMTEDVDWYLPGAHLLIPAAPASSALSARLLGKRTSLHHLRMRKQEVIEIVVHQQNAQHHYEVTPVR